VLSDVEFNRLRLRHRVHCIARETLYRIPYIVRIGASDLDLLIGPAHQRGGSCRNGRACIITGPANGQGGPADLFAPDARVIIG